MSPESPPVIDGIHHVTAICTDAQATIDFYVGLLGLRLLKVSINQGNPRVHHIFHGEEHGRPGADITFFAYPDLPRGRAGRGMVDRVIWRLESAAAVDFWERRLADAGVTVHRDRDVVALTDPDGLALELRLVAGGDPPMRGRHPEIPPDYALAGLHGVTALTGDEDPLGTGLDALLGVSGAGELRGPSRGGWFLPGPAPETPRRRGAGTVHHVAWTIEDADFERWRERLEAAGVEIVEVADRYYFRSIYFRIPSGVLFELATRGPGFTVDEPESALGSTLSIPPAFAELADELRASLPALTDPLAGFRAAGGTPGSAWIPAGELGIHGEPV